MSENLTTLNNLGTSEVPQENTLQEDSAHKIQELNEEPPKQKKGFLTKVKGVFRSKVFLIISLLVLFAGVGAFVYFTFFNDSTNLVIKDPTQVNKSDNTYVPKEESGSAVTTKDFPNPINGKYLTESNYKETTNRKPVAVMLNNHVDARPQAGISEADIIYEIVAEGGITRLMPVFHSSIPNRVGSVRSARIYYLQIAAEYWPIFSHWGIAHRPDYELGLSEAEFQDLLSKGAAETDPKADARSYIDEIALPVANTSTTPNMFYREEGINAAIEHTGYAKFEDVYTEFQKYYPEPSWSKYQKFDTWQFKDEKAEPNTVVSSISYNFWDFPNFDTVWEYEDSTNSYIRLQGGVVTIDRNNEKEVKPVNVIIQKVEEAKLNDVKGHLIYDVIGSGEATIYFDGGKTEATWEKSGPRDRTMFKDLNGNPIEFNRGLTWVVVLPTYSEVTEQ